MKFKHVTTVAVSVAVTAGAFYAAAGSASAAPAQAQASGHTLPANARFYVPPPAKGSLAQVGQLIRSGNFRDAGLIAAMEAVPSAVWLTGETSEQAAMPGDKGWKQANRDVARQVREAVLGARLQHAIPVFVAYNIPGRDCSEYSAGGAPTDAAYRAWIDSIAAALGNTKAVVLEEPDALGNLPGYCGASYTEKFPQITNATRLADIRYAVSALEKNPNVNLYLDAGNNNWQNVGGMAETLVAADVEHSQGFFLNVSNFQYSLNNDFYGTWVSSCIAYAKAQGEGLEYAQPKVEAFSGTSVPTGAFAGPGTADPAGGPAGGCANQYWNGGAPGTAIADMVGPWNGGALNPFALWSDTSTTANLNTSGIDQSYANALASVGAVPATHFIVDTSRNGIGPNDMQAYAKAPYNQSSSVVSALVAGNWCNPTNVGLGTKPTADTGVKLSSLDTYLTGNPSLLDAYLWVKTPGQSDGQCDAAGGTRTWDNTAYTPTTISGWPSATSQTYQTFDPLWSLQTGKVFTDPVAGGWFPEQALMLARNASPSLISSPWFQQHR